MEVDIGEPDEEVPPPPPPTMTEAGINGDEEFLQKLMDANGKINMREVTTAIWVNRKDARLVQAITRQLINNSNEKTAFNGIEFYLPQLAHMIVHLEVELPDSSLEQFALIVCQQSLHVALQLNWILTAALEDYQPEAADGKKNPNSNVTYFNRCIQLLQNVERIVAVGRPRADRMETRYMQRADTESHFEMELNNKKDLANRVINSPSRSGLHSVGGRTEGYLYHKRWVHKSRYTGRSWIQRWFCIEDKVLYCYQRQPPPHAPEQTTPPAAAKADGGEAGSPENRNGRAITRGVSEVSRKRLKRVIVLYHAKIVSDSKSYKDGKYEHYFEIHSPVGNWRLRAQNAADKQRWIEALEKAISSVPNVEHIEVETVDAIMSAPGLVRIGQTEKKVVSVQKSRSFEFFDAEREFVRNLTDICEELRFVQNREARLPLLEKRLHEIQLPSTAYLPLCKSTDIFRTVIAIAKGEAKAFSTKARCLAMVTFESVMQWPPRHFTDGDDSEPLDVANYLHMHFSSSFHFHDLNMSTRALAENSLDVNPESLRAPGDPRLLLEKDRQKSFFQSFIGPLGSVVGERGSDRVERRERSETGDRNLRHRYNVWRVEHPQFGQFPSPFPQGINIKGPSIKGPNFANWRPPSFRAKGGVPGAAGGGTGRPEMGGIVGGSERIETGGRTWRSGSRSHKAERRGSATETVKEHDDETRDLTESERQIELQENLETDPSEHNPEGSAHTHPHTVIEQVHIHVADEGEEPSISRVRLESPTSGVPVDQFVNDNPGSDDDNGTASPIRKSMTVPAAFGRRSLQENTTEFTPSTSIASRFHLGSQERRESRSHSHSEHRDEKGSGLGLAMSSMTGKVTYGETMEEKANRLKAVSNAGNRRGWGLERVIAKSNDDVRQEVFVMQLIYFYEEVFQKEELDLWVQPYRILSLSKTTGLIQVLENSVSLDGLKKKADYAGNLDLHFQASFGPRFSPGHTEAIRRFAQSMAGYAVLSYLIGFKDRHNGNIMITAEGRLIHIDFGFVLGIAPGNKFSMERAAFKFTQECADVMGGRGSDTYEYFREMFAQGLLSARKFENVAATLIEIMMFRSEFPCFSNKTGVLKAFKRRLRDDLTDDQFKAFGRTLVDRSLNHWGTRFYDKFQLWSNGIQP